MWVGGLVMTGARATAILVICSLLFHVTYQISSLPMLILVFGITMVALYGMGMMLASVFLATGREAWHFSNLLQEPIYLASGFYFPIKVMGFWVATAASILPLTLGLDAIRQLLFAAGPSLGFLSVTVEMTILSVLAVVFITGAYLALAKMEEIGRREGRLIERRR